jgi:hypothetical protein
MYKQIRELAKSTKWQNLYSRAKEISGIKLFNNDTDFSLLQHHMMYLLETYYSLYIDLYSDKPYISKKVIENDLRTEAYLLWKNKNKNKPLTKKKENKQDNKVPGIIFTSRSK